QIDLRCIRNDDLDCVSTFESTEPPFLDTAEWILAFEQGFDDLASGATERLGPFLVALRVARAMTLSEASRASGVNPSTIARLEKCTAAEQDRQLVRRLLRFYGAPRRLTRLRRFVERGAVKLIVCQTRPTRFAIG
ncbi:MAG: helix-turn-helix transcriptional regulator, partial [Planctomycetota bacterium]